MGNFKEFLRRDWENFKREFFRIPSLFSLLPLLLIGAFFLGRAGLQEWRRREAQQAFEQRAAKILEEGRQQQLQLIEEWKTEQRRQGFSEEHIRRTEAEMLNSVIRTNR